MLGGRPGPGYSFATPPDLGGQGGPVTAYHVTLAGQGYLVDLAS